MISVSVIIPVYNDANRLALCLDALSQQTVPANEFEIIVVDNGSDNPPEDVVRGRTNCQLLHQQKPGSYAARNRGLQVARGEYLAFTDADCLPSQDWLAAGIRALQENPRASIVGGDILIFPKVQQRPSAVELFDIAFGLPQQANITKRGRCMTANLFTRRSVFDEVGVFDEHIFSGGDHMWCNRVTEAGGQVMFEQQALIRHPARDSMDDLLRQAKREMGGRVDRRKVEKYRGRWGRTLRNIARMYLPNIGKIMLAKENLAKRGYGLGSWIRVSPVILYVQYVRGLELIKTFLFGRPTERS